MRPRIASLIVGAAAALAIVASPATAAGGRPLTITLEGNFTTGVETFTASGAFCPSGSAVSFDFWRTGGASYNNQFHLSKTFTCDDGSGSLTIHLNAAWVNTHGGTIGGWQITGGTGAYAGASGGGQIVGVGIDKGITYTYSGIINN